MTTSDHPSDLQPNAPADDYDVLIVGCGPVGLTLANLLGSMGVRTLALERNDSTVAEPRAVSIDDESLRILQSIGLADLALESIVPGYGSHYYSANGARFASVEPSGAPYGYPRRNAFRQPALERLLRQSLARYACVESRFGCRLTAFAADENGVTANLTSSDGRPCAVRSAFIVGCDGASSMVRETLGVTMDGTTFNENWLIVDLENHDNRIKHTEVFCNFRRPAITLPGPQRTRRFEFKILPGEDKEKFFDPAFVRELLAAHGADPQAVVTRQTIYRFHARLASQWRKGRALLAGDAAHLSPPFAGQGMNSGLRDAHNLAWKLAAVVRGELGMLLLDSYEAERKHHAWRMIQLALTMGRVMAPKSALAALATQSAFRALGLIPPARAYVAQMKYKPKPRFVAGFILPDGRNARRTRVGRLFPQPIVLASTGANVRLDDALGHGFAVLAYDPPAQFWTQFTHPIWDRLAVGRIAIRPNGQPSSRSEGAMTIIDVTRELAAAFTGRTTAALLLRPDRYALAEIPFDSVERSAAALAALVERTWGLGGSNGVHANLGEEGARTLA